ncbi:hypothetical protein SNE40_003704 [Patella caerulea]|uniref:3-oxoacyl-[acyl-carrier-protein] synthase n=1 Tax=Patella caerulea TaxID=87958 RepID=A0AAN8KAD6_PATCE
MSSLSRSRVVVTGLGLITCLGVGVDKTWKNLISGQCGITQLPTKEYEKIPCKVAGVVPCGAKDGELNIAKHFTPTELRGLPLSSAYAMIAAEEALNMAKWKPDQEEERIRTGVAIGMGMVSLEEIADVGEALRGRGYNRVSPHFIPRILVNMAAGHVSIKHGLKGPNHAVSTACTTGLHAIGDAYSFIQRGVADVMVAGGTEASVSPLSIAGFSRMRALSTNFNNNPQEASRPFDKDRDGFVMSEGCGVVVLEEMNHAINRGANIIAEIQGYGLSGDAHHITSPSEDGDGAYRCMQTALKDGNIDIKDIGYVNAHATSTPIGDAAESRAIEKLFNNENKHLLVSSTKGAVGHLLGAAGSVEAVFTVLACQSGQIPPTNNLKTSDTGCDLNYVAINSVPWSAQFNRKIALTNSFGFGGTNGSLCISDFIQ